MTGVDDDEDDDDQPYEITFSVTSSDAGYNGLAIAPTSIANRDDDGTGVLVTGAENLETSEAGATATVQMQLATRPTAADRHPQQQRRHRRYGLRSPHLCPEQLGHSPERHRDRGG